MRTVKREKMAQGKPTEAAELDRTKVMAVYK